jgi:hypothetical protein
MKATKMLTIVVLALGLMVWSAPIVHGAQYLKVNGQDVNSITLKMGQGCFVEIVSDDSNLYTAYVGFDNGLVLGVFVHLETVPLAGDLANVTDYNMPAFRGYYISAAGASPPPSAGIHFVFEYMTQQLGETDLKLYDSTFTSVIDSVHITVIPTSMGTAFTYQGRLMDSNSPADGLYDFRFKLYDNPDPVFAVHLESTIDINDFDVIDGYFTVELDFGSDVFDGDARWLEIDVRPGDSNDPTAFVTLRPRTELTATPYAIYAATAGADNDWMVSMNDMYSIPSGNVGIGTTAPAEKLSVAGTIESTIGGVKFPDGSVQTTSAAALSALIASLQARIESLENPRSWGMAELIEMDNAGNALDPQVAVDPSGNAVAVWGQDDGTRNNIWSNRYVAGTGWGWAELIETDDAGGADFPQVAVDVGGNAVAVWYQDDGTRNNIWSNRYVAGTGWGTAELIETDNLGNALAPQVAVEPSGNAVAVWYQWDGTRYNIYSNRYVAGTGWGTAELIETDNAGWAFDPQVAVDVGGNAVAVWGQDDGIRNNIWSNRYVAGTGWGTAELIETDAGDAYSPQVVVDGSGNAVAVWRQSDGTRDNIWSNRYVAGTGWGTPELIEGDNTGDVISPQVAVDGSGNAFAVWRQSAGSNIWSNRYVAGTGWGSAELIETYNAGAAIGPQVAVDDSGNAFAVWQQWDGTRYNIYSNRYVAGTAWGTAELIETDNAGFAWSPQVAVNGSGNAFAVWEQSDGTRYNIYSNRYFK